MVEWRSVDDAERRRTLQRGVSTFLENLDLVVCPIG